MVGSTHYEILWDKQSIYNVLPLRILADISLESLGSVFKDVRKGRKKPKKSFPKMQNSISSETIGILSYTYKY